MNKIVYEPASPELLASWHHMMKRAMAKANRAAEDWDKRSAVVNDWCDSQGFTIKRRAVYRREDTDLKEHFDTYTYYSGEIQRFNAMIQAEAAMRALLGKDT